MPKKFYALNQHIRAQNVRVVDDKANQLGVMTKEEALMLAKSKELDLVLVAAKAEPPVVKLINFAKFKYQQQQKEASGKKKTKHVDIKEVRFTPFIAKGDYEVRIKKIREFLEAGNKVKINVKFTGRQITRKQFGESLVEKMIAELTDISVVEREPAFQGKVLVCQLQPKKAK